MAYKGNVLMKIIGKKNLFLGYQPYFFKGIRHKLKEDSDLIEISWNSLTYVTY